MVMIRNGKALYALTSCLISPNQITSTNSFGLSLHRSTHTASAFIGSAKGNGVIRTTRNMSINTEDTTVADIPANLSDVQSRVAQTIKDCNLPENSVRLIAVSKTKPIDLLMKAYNAGQRYFGENYAQELIGKAEEMPADIKWHFIGPLQSNKAGPLVKSLGLKKLACIETVSTMKLANKLNNAVNTLIEQNDDTKEGDKLNIYLQVNTSGEESKSGVDSAKKCAELAVEISNTCANLHIAGLMTIGASGDYSCFDTLVDCRNEVADALSGE